MSEQSAVRKFLQEFMDRKNVKFCIRRTINTKLKPSVGPNSFQSSKHVRSNLFVPINQAS
jgi:hypothetical protein